MSSPSSQSTFVLVPVVNGKLAPTDSQKRVIAAFLHRMDGKHVRVSFGTPTKNRSGNQNKYYWGVVLTMIAAETGHTTEEIHEYLKDMLLPKVYVSINGKERQLAKSTTSLDTFFFEQYLDQVRSFAATELNMTIPMPNEIDS